MLLGHPSKAIGNLDSAIALDPLNPNLYRRRALAHKQLKEPRAAAADLEAAIRLNGGTYPEAERLLNAVYNDAAIKEVTDGRLSEAHEYIEKALERDPTIARSFVNRADILHKLGETGSALEDYARARELTAPSAATRDDELAWEVECKVSLLHYESGTALFNRTDYAGAFAEFTHAVTCNPRVGQYLLSRAEVATILKRWDIVRADAEAALALNPADARARAILSRVVPA
jgi:tetratricopeptide (TPR) repeat protein